MVPYDWVVIHIHKSHLFWCEQKGYRVLTHNHSLYQKMPTYHRIFFPDPLWPGAISFDAAVRRKLRGFQIGHASVVYAASTIYGFGSNLVALVNIKKAGKWVFTPLTLIMIIVIGFDTHPYCKLCCSFPLDNFVRISQQAQWPNLSPRTPYVWSKYARSIKPMKVKESNPQW